MPLYCFCTMVVPLQDRFCTARTPVLRPAPRPEPVIPEKPKGFIRDPAQTKVPRSTPRESAAARAGSIEFQPHEDRVRVLPVALKGLAIGKAVPLIEPSRRGEGGLRARLQVEP